MTQPTRIRSLRPGEPIPQGRPRRYKSGAGYVRLRWRIGTRAYVECYEHRVDGDHVTTAEHVHHVNRVRDDNRPENLRPLTQEEHSEEHAPEYADDIVWLYEQGLSTVRIAAIFGLNTSSVFRQLASRGVTMRASTEYARKPDMQAIRFLHGHGVRTGRIAQTLGLTHRAVDRALAELGLPRFRAGRPSPDELRRADQAVHAWIESRRTEALDEGWLVRQGHDPATAPVLTWDGWRLLNPDGTWSEP